MDVLLVEDNPADVYLVREEFAALGDAARLAVAGSVTEASHALIHARPDVVLLNLSLPDSIGLDTYTAIQKKAPDLPVIVVSGTDDRTMAIQAVRSGAQDYVLKGRMDPELLLRTLTYAIERARARAELRQAEARYRRLYDSVPVGVFQMSSTGVLQSVNATLIRLLGYESEAEVLRAERAGSLFADTDQKAAALRLLVGTGTLEGFEIDLYHRAGNVLTLLANAAAVRDEATGKFTVEGTLADITRRKQTERQLRNQAEVDELTGVANRRAFRSIVSAALAGAEGFAANVMPAIMLFDLDGFKAVNDTFGHAAGDQVLKEVVRRVTGALRSEDVFARIGGDEFTIYCTAGSRSDLERVADKVRDIVTKPFHVDGKETLVGTSIGIARFPEDGRDYDTLLAAADKAMYAAKKGGKGCYVFADCAA